MCVSCDLSRHLSRGHTSCSRYTKCAFGHTVETRHTREEGRGKREERRGKREEGRGKREERVSRTKDKRQRYNSLLSPGCLAVMRAKVPSETVSRQKTRDRDTTVFCLLAALLS